LVKEAKPELFENTGKNMEKVEGPASLLTVLTRLNSDPNTEHHLNEDEVFGIYFTLFGAGTSTMSRLLSISLYLLTQYPQYKVAIRGEARAVIKDFDDFGFEEVSKLKMLDAFLKEVLRLYAQLQEVFPREAINDGEIGNIKVKRGTLVSAYLNSNCWNEKYYKDGEKFIPERWMLEKEQKDPFSYLPFWAGPRHCLGKYLAEIEAKVFLTKVLNRFDLEVKEGFELKMQQRVVYEPTEQIPMKFKRLVE